MGDESGFRNYRGDMKGEWGRVMRRDRVGIDLTKIVGMEGKM
jgi:hypothetical protein